MKRWIGFFCLPGSLLAESYGSSYQEGLVENPTVEKQIGGDYGDFVRPPSLPLGMIQKAWDGTQGEGGIYKVIYRSGEVIKIRIREFMTSTVILPQWERISEIVVGDPSSYEVKPLKPHILCIRSLENIGIDSTLTLIGESGRVYTFYMRTEGYNSKNVSDVAVYVKVPYSGADPAKPLSQRPETEKDYLQDAYFDPSKIRFDFSMYGDKSIAPERVYSDGIRTWFDFGERIHQQNLPTIYRVEDGIDTPVNVSRDGNKVVAQASGDFTLKHGIKTVCVLKSKSDQKS